LAQLVCFQTIKWVNDTYPDDVGSCSAVTFTEPLSDAKALGAWAQLDLKTNLMLMGKNWKGDLYAYVSTGAAPIHTGCCADTMRIWSKVKSTTIELRHILTNVYKL